MTIDGIKYFLTDHGRQRYLERSGDVNATDEQIIQRCIGNRRAVWKENGLNSLRLVTYHPWNSERRHYKSSAEPILRKIRRRAD